MILKKKMLEVLKTLLSLKMKEKNIKFSQS